MKSAKRPGGGDLAEVPQAAGPGLESSPTGFGTQAAVVGLPQPLNGEFLHSYDTDRAGPDRRGPRPRTDDDGSAAAPVWSCRPRRGVDLVRNPS